MRESLIEARRWYLQARDDLRAAATLRLGGHFAQGCFFAQQAAEKGLKAVLYSQGARVVLGHSARQLAEECRAHDPTFAGVVPETLLLDQYYIPTRYPNGLPSPVVPGEFYSLDQAMAAEEAAEKVLGFVETFLRSKTQALSD